MFMTVTVNVHDKVHRMHPIHTSVTQKNITNLNWVPPTHPQLELYTLDIFIFILLIELELKEENSF